jgi:dienelactone hydrolase
VIGQGEETAAMTPTAIPAEMPAPVDVQIPGAEGLILAGTYVGVPGVPSPAVLLLHMYGKDRTTWSDFALRLQGAGVASLAIDLRGFGGTGGGEDWKLAIEDVRAALAWQSAQPGVDKDKLAVVGASIGANLSMLVGAEDATIAAIGLLSPGFDYFRVKIDQEMMRQYGARPALLAAAESDGYSAETVRSLAQAAQGKVDLLLYPGSAHGTDLLQAHADFGDRLLKFLAESLAR